MAENTIHRIKKYIDSKGIRVSVLEREVGMSNGSFASQLKNNKTIGVDKLENILRKYTDVNPEWLLTGNGQMLKGTKTLEDDFLARQKIKNLSNTIEIPVYDIQTTTGFLELFTDNSNLTPVNYINVPKISECDGAVYIVGDSMFPLLKAGDIAVYKNVKNPTQNIIWGEMYLVYINNDGNEFCFTRFLKKSKDKLYFQLVSQNPQYDIVEFPIKSIKALALIKATVRINS